MGTTAASLHLLRLEAPAEIYVALLEKAYGRLGWGRPRRGGAAQRRVTLAAAGDFVTLHDSACAGIDDGTLAELAALLGKALGVATLVTSVLDSDSFALLVYERGRQVDAAGAPAEAPDAGVKTLRGRRQATLWAKLFPAAALRRLAEAGGDPAAASARFQAEAEAAAALASPFAEDQLAAWCALAGLDAGQALGGADGAAAQDRVLATLDLAPRATAATRAPAAAPAGRELRFLFSEDDCPWQGFHPAAWPCRPGRQDGYRWFVVCAGGGLRGVTLRLDRAPGSPFRLAAVSLRALSFFNGQVTSLTPLAQWEHACSEAEATADSLCLAAPDFTLREPTPGSRAQAVLILRLDLLAPAAGEVDIRPSLQADGEAVPLALPPLRLAATTPAWTPLIAAPAAPHAAEEEALLRLNAPAIRHAVAILADGAAARAGIRALAEAALGCFAAPGLEARLATEKHMTPSFRVPKATQVLPLADLPAAKAWPALFDAAGNHQTVRIGIAPPGAPWPLAGITLQAGLRDDARPAPEPPLYLALWHNTAAEAALGLDRQRLEDAFLAWLRQAGPWQAWLAESAWIPLFDRYEDYASTPYETVGTDAQARMRLRGAAEGGEDWLRHRLKFVAPRLWLGATLAGRLDQAALAAVADLHPAGTAVELALRPGQPLAALERALHPILPLQRG